MIDAAGLPHPVWEFVKRSEELKKFSRTRAYAGWTVRKVAERGVSWKTLYANNLKAADVPQTVGRFQKQCSGQAVFAVYPSWYWRVGGSILAEKNSLIIEASSGHIHNLMRHGQVEAQYTYVGNRLQASSGRIKIVPPAVRRRMLQGCRRLRQKNVLLEWSISTQGKLIFYRMNSVKDLGKELLQKYS